MFDFTNDGERDRSPQGLFTAAYLGVMMQGKGSVDATGRCACRGENGARCAVGWLEDDDDTAHGWDRVGGSVYSITASPIAPQWFIDNEELLADMQDAHDTWIVSCGNKADSTGFIPFFQRKMKWVAEKHGLTVPAIAPVGA